MIRTVGEYVFEIVGDDENTRIQIPLSALKAPEPIRDGVMPSGIFDAEASKHEVAATIDDAGNINLEFDSPPSADQTTEVRIRALFGTDRV
jgi:hypothetical protein